MTLSASGEGVAPQGSIGGGEIAGIVIGVICGVVLLIGALIFLPKRFDFIHSTTLFPSF